MQKKLKKLFNNDFFISLVVKAIAIITGLISTVFLNRYLGVELKGVYAYYINIVNLLVVVFNLGFSNIYSYAKRSKMENVKKLFYNISYLEFFVILILVLLIALFLNINISPLVLVLIATTNIYNQLNIYILIDNIKYRQKVNICISIINVILTMIAFFIFTRNVDVGYGILLTKDLIGIALILFKEKIKIDFSLLSKKIFKFWLKYGLFAMFAGILLTINYKVDTIFIGNMLRDVDTGIYSVGIAFAEYGWIIADSFKEVIQHKTSINDSIEDINFAISINLIIVLLYVIVFLLLGGFIIEFLYGYEYVPATNITRLLLVGCFSMVIFKLTAPVYLANGKQLLYLVVLLVSAISNILLNIVLIPRLELYGAAFASVVSYSICGMFFYFKYIFDYKLKWYDPLIGIKKIKRFLKKEINI